MQLVEQGKLALDAPISTYIPRAAELQVLEGLDEKGEPRLRPPKRQITLRHLMTHTSGHGLQSVGCRLRPLREGRANFPILASGQDEAFYAAADVRSRANGGNTASRSTGSAGSCADGQRQEPRHLHAGEHLQPARDDQHGLQADARHGSAAGGDRTSAPRTASSPRSTCNGQPQPAARARRRRTLLDGAGDYLQFVRMILNGGRATAIRFSSPRLSPLMGKNAMGDTRVVMLKTTNPCPLGGCRVLPGPAEELGPHLHDQRASRPRPAAPPAALPGPVSTTPSSGSIRPRNRRRVHGPGPAVRRPARPCRPSTTSRPPPIRRPPEARALRRGSSRQLRTSPAGALNYNSTNTPDSTSTAVSQEMPLTSRARARAKTCR